MYLQGVYHSPRHLLLHVLFLLTIAFLYLERQHEDTLYHNIIRVTKEKEGRETADTVYIRALMQTIHTMMFNRQAIFRNTEVLSYKNQIFHSVDEDLMYGHGACGGFSKVLSRSLQLSGYRVRIGQMQVNGVLGGHIIVEVWLDAAKRWVVIDPFFLLTFPGADGYWAGFQEIKRSWEQYRQLVPANYKPDYTYEGIRYTNWEKVPVAGKLVYALLELALGKEAAHGVSVRIYLLNMYAVWLNGAVLLFALFCVFSYRRFHRQSQVRAVRASQA